MSIGSSNQRLREDFEAQFEFVDDNRYLYRRNQRGEPIPVSRHERDRMIAHYMQRVRFILGGMMGALLTFVALLIWWTVSTGNELPDPAIYVGTVAIAVIAIGLMYRVRGAPARELKGRSSIGRERSKDEIRAIIFRKISYGQLAGAAAVGVILVINQAAKEDIFSGWHRIWLVLGAGLVVLAIVQAVRKWLFESQYTGD